MFVPNGIGVSLLQRFFAQRFQVFVGENAQRAEQASSGIFRAQDEVIAEEEKRVREKCFRVHAAASSSSPRERTLMIFRGGRLGRNKGWQHIFFSSSKHSLSSLSVVCFSLLLCLLCSSLFMRSRRASVRRRACSHKQTRVEEREVSTIIMNAQF